VRKTANDGSIAAKIIIRSEQYEELGSCIILQTRPLTVLVPSHVCVSIEDGTAQSIVVDTIEYGEFRLLPTPFLEREHLSIIRFKGNAFKNLDSVAIPRRPASLVEGCPVECLKQTSDEASPSVHGELTRIIKKGTETTLITSLPASPGDSGSPLLAKKQLVGICVGMTATDDGNKAVAVPLSQVALREIRNITLHRSRFAVFATLAVVLLLLSGLVVRSWTTFDIAGVDGPMNSSQSEIKTPNTITAQNSQLLTFRSTWSRTFPTSIRWWVPFSSTSGIDRIDYIVIGTRAEEGTHGSLFLLDNMGRTVWSYTVPDGNCVYSNDKETFNGFNVYRAFVGDLTGDGQNEVLASFVHDFWYPCEILIFSLSGEVLGEYWHPGYVRTFAIGKVGNSETPMLIMTGSNNRFRALDSPWNPQGLMAFDVAALSGEAPPYTGSGEQGNVLWYYLLPDVDAEHKSSIVDIVIADSDGDGITELLARTSDDRFYYLNEDGEVLRVELGDEYLKEFGNIAAPELQRVELDPGQYENWPL
jgi:hypothetical protein